MVSRKGKRVKITLLIECDVLTSSITTNDRGAGITGASGVIYGVWMVEAIAKAGRAEEGFYRALSLQIRLPSPVCSLRTRPIPSR